MTPEYITNRCERVTETGCWIWLLTLNHDGYGVASKHTKNVRAHRLSWELHNGPIPIGMLVCHTCDIRCCVNPDHLFIGTPARNSQDMVNRGRSDVGERHHDAKLTDKDVVAIRADKRYGRIVAQDYGVCKSTIDQIRAGETWRHVSVVLDD